MGRKTPSTEKHGPVLAKSTWTAKPQASALSPMSPAVLAPTPAQLPGLIQACGKHRVGAALLARGASIHQDASMHRCASGLQLGRI